MLELEKVEKVFQDMNYLIDLEDSQFVSELNFDKDVGYYFDNIKGKYVIRLYDPRIKGIYLIKRK